MTADPSPCTCGGYGPPYYIHEPHCGQEPPVGLTAERGGETCAFRVCETPEQHARTCPCGNQCPEGMPAETEAELPVVLCGDSNNHPRHVVDHGPGEHYNCPGRAPAWLAELERVQPAACPTCTGPGRETVGMVCQACGTDYGPPAETLDLGAIEAQTQAFKPGALIAAVRCIPDGEIRHGCVVSDGTRVKAAVRAAYAALFKHVPALLARVRELDGQLAHVRAAMGERIADRDRDLRAVMAERDTARRDGAADALRWAATRYGMGSSPLATWAEMVRDGTLTIPTTTTEED